MASYIMLSTLTDEGRKTLKERPERLQAVNKEVESMGARVTSQYAVLGGYDFVNVIEAPTNEVMAMIAMAAQATDRKEMPRRSNSTASKTNPIIIKARCDGTVAPASRP